MMTTCTVFLEPLTGREREIAQAVARGLRNRQIALEFGLKKDTVKKHLTTIYSKLALDGRVALAVYVWKSGLGNLAQSAVDSRQLRVEARTLAG